MLTWKAHVDNVIKLPVLPKKTLAFNVDLALLEIFYMCYMQHYDLKCSVLQWEYFNAGQAQTEQEHLKSMRSGWWGTERYRDNVWQTSHQQTVKFKPIHTHSDRNFTLGT